MRNCLIVLVLGIVALVFDLTHRPKPDPEAERVAARKAELVEQVNRANDELEKATDKLEEEFPQDPGPGPEDQSDAY